MQPGTVHLERCWAGRQSSPKARCGRRGVVHWGFSWNWQGHRSAYLSSISLSLPSYDLQGNLGPPLT